MEYTFDEQLFSDFYKEAYGFRPRNHKFYNDSTTDSEKQKIWNNIINEVENSIIFEEKCKKESARVFEQRIKSLFEIGCLDRQTAIRWIILSENISTGDLGYGASFLLYTFDLPNSYFKEMTDMIEICLNY